MSKMHLTLIDQSLEKSKSWKKARPAHNSYDVSKEVNIDHNSFKLFGEGCKKKLDVWMSHDLTVKNLMDR